MKVVALSLVHALRTDRRYVYDFFLKRMYHIKQKYGIDMLVVGSDYQLSEQMTKAAGFKYLEYENKPVSNKWNAGMAEVKKLDPDYVITLDSDDILCDNLIELYLQAMEEGNDAIGVKDSYFVNINPKRAGFGVCGYWTGYGKERIMGCSRAHSRKVLEACDWKLWPEGWNASLNNRSRLIIYSQGFKLKEKAFSIMDENVLHIDVKAGNNISSMSPLARNMHPVDFEKLLRKHLPEKETEKIINYYKKATYGRTVRNEFCLKKKNG